ncbi:MAG: type IV toxin-antitoxin system AbiEi family antitoxin domain-containing protein [Solirubrobacterales bacterium]
MGNKRRAHSEIAALATAQYGVVSSRQLQARGFSRKSIASEAAADRWRRLHRGVYAVGHEALAWEGRCMAAVLACQPCVASHWTAAWLWGLLRSKPDSAFHLTAANTRHRRGEFVVHSAALTGEDIRAVREHPIIPVTSLERTHLDLAAAAPERLDRFLERSEELRLFDLRRFDSLLARTAGHPGHAPLRQALRAYRPEPAVLRSNLERDFRELIRASSLPPPSHNYLVGPYELDCYWPEHCFCVELDTFGTHGSRRSFEADRKRQRELRRLGVELERVTDLQLEREPEEVLAAVRRGLRL